MEVPAVSNGIPIIDLGPMVRGEEGGLASVSTSFASAFLDMGFAYIVNHGIEQEIIGAKYNATDPNPNRDAFILTFERVDTFKCTLSRQMTYWPSTSSSTPCR